MAHLTGYPSDIRPRRTDAGRRQTALLESVGLAILLVLLVVAACSTTADRAVDRTAVHRVTEGETLWSLAESVRTPGQTTEQTMHAIAELNGIEPAGLMVGSIIELPTTDELATAQAMR